MSDIYLLYVGKDKGALFGIPARNMTEEEARQYNIPELIKTGLYEYANRPMDISEKYNFDDMPKRKRRKE